MKAKKKKFFSPYLTEEYPIWWYQMPMVMQNFFDAYDFSGKTIIPFNTHLGSRDGGTYEDIAELEPDILAIVPIIV